MPSGNRQYVITDSAGGAAPVDLSGVTSQLNTLTTRLGVPVGPSVAADVASTLTVATAARDRLPATLQAGRVRAHLESINGVGAIGAGGTGNQGIGAV